MAYVKIARCSTSRWHGESLCVAAQPVGIPLCKSSVLGKVAENSAGKVAHSYLTTILNLRMNTT